MLIHILTKENLRPIAEVLASAMSERNEDVNTRITVVERSLYEVKKSICQLLDAIETAGISASIQARLREREAQERRLIADLVNLQDLLVAPKAIAAVSEQQLDEWLDSIRQALTGDIAELARQAIRQFVGKLW